MQSASSPFVYVLRVAHRHIERNSTSTCDECRLLHHDDGAIKVCAGTPHGTLCILCQFGENEIGSTVRETAGAAVAAA